MHARLAALDRHDRVGALAEQSARREEPNASLAEFSTEVCCIFALRALAGLVVVRGAVRRQNVWEAVLPCPGSSRPDAGPGRDHTGGTGEGARPIGQEEPPAGGRQTG